MKHHPGTYVRAAARAFNWLVFLVFGVLAGHYWSSVVAYNGIDRALQPDVLMFAWGTFAIALVAFLLNQIIQPTSSGPADREQ
jgi:hypothetical protein